MRRHRWNSIGATRKRLARLLTAYVQSVDDANPIRQRSGPMPVREVRPERISAMRLVGRSREWEDAHSWKAFPSWVGEPESTAGKSLYSYDSMTKCVRAGRLHPIGKDGELSI